MERDGHGQLGRLGRHVPIAGGVVDALERTRAAGYDAVQVFPGNPKGWRHVPMEPDAAAIIRAEALRLDVRPVVIHAPYIINLAAAEDELATNSARSLANTLERARDIAAAYVVVHSGSAKGAGEEVGIARVARLLESVRDTISPLGATTVKNLVGAGTAAAPTAMTTRILLENGAGAGSTLAGSPEALGRLLAALPHTVGACIDTAHLWGAGCDLSSAPAVDAVLERLDRAVGLDRIGVIHLNDSAVPLGSHRDVHARLGEGTIGLPGLAAWLAHPALRRHPVILETPLEDDPVREAARCAITRQLREGDVDGAAQALAALQESGDVPGPFDANVKTVSGSAGRDERGTVGHRASPEGNVRG